MIKQFNISNKSAEELYQADLDNAKNCCVTVEGNKPYFSNKLSDMGVLLIHGFAASPEEMKPLANKLESLGITVYLVRVAGHGSTLNDFYKTSFEDWYNSIYYGYNALLSTCKKICVVGQSNGGLLTTAVAKYNKCDALVLLAPAYKVRIPGYIFIKHIRKIIKNIPRYIEDKEHNYKVFPTEQLYQLQLLQNEVKKYIKDINMPVLLAISENDTLISTKEALKTVDLMASSDKTTFQYNNKLYKVKHILTEKHSEKIINDIALWIREKIK